MGVPMTVDWQHESKVEICPRVWVIEILNIASNLYFPLLKLPWKHLAIVRRILKADSGEICFSEASHREQLSMQETV